MKTVAKNDYLELITDVQYGNREKTVIHQTRLTDHRADFAKDIIKAWGLVSARPALVEEPKDDKGLTLLPVSEVVSRACEITELAFVEFERRGWLLNIPSFQEMNKIED